MQHRCKGSRLPSGPAPVDGAIGRVPDGVDLVAGRGERRRGPGGLSSALAGGTGLQAPEEPAGPGSAAYQIPAIGAILDVRSPHPDLPP